MVDAARIRPEEFASEALRMFDQLDGEVDGVKDGYLSNKELAKAVENPKYVGKDAQIIASLRALKLSKKDGYVKSLHQDRDNERGITKGDLSSLDSHLVGVYRQFHLFRLAKLWSRSSREVDVLDENGLLSREKVTLALRNTSALDARTLGALIYLESHFDELAAKKNAIVVDPSTIVRTLEPKFEGALRDINTEIFAVVEAVINRTATYKPNSRTIADRQLCTPPEEIGINQYLVLDCFFVGTLISDFLLSNFSKSYSEASDRIIQDNLDGTFLVTFPGDQSHPIRINKPTAAEWGLYTHGLKELILEKALGQYFINHYYAYPSEIPQAEAAGSLVADRHREAFYLLTGKEPEEYFMATSSLESVSKRLLRIFPVNNHPTGLAVAFVNKKAFIFDTFITARNIFFKIPMEDPTKNGFVRSHVYSIVGFEYNDKDPGNSKVMIRDPLGYKSRGVRTISLLEFYQNFHYLLSAVLI